jgi:hypothetical protein
MSQARTSAAPTAQPAIAPKGLVQNHVKLETLLIALGQMISAL